MKRTTPDHVASNRSGNNLPPQTNEGDVVASKRNVCDSYNFYNPTSKNFCLLATTTSLAFETIFKDDTDPSPSYL